MKAIISVTDFKPRCMEMIRRVERTGKPVSITRHGKVVARLLPAAGVAGAGALKPWEQLRGRGKWLAEPEETFISAADLKGL